MQSAVSNSAYEAKYVKSREKALQLFIDNFPSMLGYWDKDLINVHSNKVYAEYFGKKPKDIRGRSMKELLEDKIFNLNLPYVNEALKGIPQTFERSIPTPSGLVRHTLASYIPHSIHDGVAGFFVVVTDISEKKNLEDRTRNLESALYEQSRLSSLGQMASGIAHEINNPMAVIYSDACLLLNEFKKTEIKRELIIERLMEIEGMALRVEQIVSGLSSVTRGVGHHDLEPTNIVELVKSSLVICKSRFDRENIALALDFPKESIQVQCCKVQISEILINLLNNAFDALKGIDRGKVLISIKAIKDQCIISVSNNGPSISDEIRKKMFLPFFTTKGKSGTGLGLKISKDLATANNGTLILTDGAVTRFELRLPL